MYCLFSTSLFDSYKSPTLRFLYAICKGAKSNLDIGNLFFCGEGPPMSNGQGVEPVRVFVATWNVGGKSPHSGLNLDDFLHVHDQADIYVLGFQEIVPLNAGNVLVVEDNEPAARWLQLINQSLNKSPAVYVFNSPTHPHDNRSVGLRGLKTTATTGGSLFFPKYSLKAFSQTFRTESGKRLKTCSCTSELERKYGKDCCFQCPKSSIRDDESSSEEDDEPNSFSTASSTKHMKYSLIACRQMVGIFVTIWMKKELVQHVSHLRISCISRGIMGCLGNKGCISVRMTFHQTSFCFICSHLASGEKEGDELRRNLDVIETLKNTQFPKICRTPASGVPEKILDHERVIWFGDLNYRIALSYSETRKLLEENAWDALLDKDQLKIEREAGRVFKGWQEGKIYFAPTYKYRNNSDTYAGDTTKSKTKRRTPAWCDRILWHGHGIRQLSYIRGESQFSDHRPVCATFLVDVNVPHSRAEML
ncbi:type I inositol polyphosphate 5-phosphatase 10 isoform X2 [Vitis vinifera]|uniref:type I inositol polyphosphate 5-phosphatase 10 isoform X2 n=1 Tax=Vitis vinifera TaxID=29760 RepID=UPI00053FA686|nr:type I inositol polyphosphate 5-phosphatase 10 isoform X2 [Vitis vinifera]|eukprot:XP_010658880.1 PREDICTED: type I inositol polyphosphate 5-phosphatase 10 isoform X2 [Vitis vinifera]